MRREVLMDALAQYIENSEQSTLIDPKMKLAQQMLDEMTRAVASGAATGVTEYLDDQIEQHRRYLLNALLGTVDYSNEMRHNFAEEKLDSVLALARNMRDRESDISAYVVKIQTLRDARKAAAQIEGV